MPALLPYLAAGHRPRFADYDADIIILTIDRFAETLDAVNSAISQSGIIYHITVLDQGSSPAVQAKFVAAFAAMQNFAYYTSDQNLGVAGGRNLLSCLGHGRIIICLDNDAVFENDSVVARAVQTFTDTPELGAIGFKILRPDGVSLDEFSWGYPRPLKRRFQDRFDTTTFVGAGHAIRRLTWVQAGGYDEALFFTWEEYDFCLAAIALNWLVRYEGSLGILHKVSAEARIGWSAARVRYFVRNRLGIARKWGHSWPALMPRIAGYLIKGIFNRRVGPTLAGIGDALKMDQRRTRRKMSPAMRRYYWRNETSHRGSLLQRLRFEVFARVNQDS